MSISPHRIIVSIISHRHGAMVADLLSDLAGFAAPELSVVLTLNVPEALPTLPAGLPVSIIRNEKPKGFGANHNAAFRAASGDYFCVLNPDVRIAQNPFPRLLALLDRPDAGVVAPLAVSEAGEIEDNARRFPTPACLTKKLLRKLLGQSRVLDYMSGGSLFEVDWVAGLFMLFRFRTFEQAHGFDECYFLYYEDVDLCARLRLAGKRTIVDPRAQVVHEARRDSHRKFKYAFWHFRSITQFFRSDVYRQLAADGLL